MEELNLRFDEVVDMIGEVGIISFDYSEREEHTVLRLDAEAKAILKKGFAATGGDTLVESSYSIHGCSIWNEACENGEQNIGGEVFIDATLGIDDLASLVKFGGLHILANEEPSLEDDVVVNLDKSALAGLREVLASQGITLD